MRWLALRWPRPGGRIANTMKEIHTDDRCPEPGCFDGMYFEPETGLGPTKCLRCQGTGRVPEPPQPTAIAGTDDAPRSGEARSEAAVGEAAPLCDGLAKLRCALETAQKEALTLMDDDKFRTSLDTMTFIDFQCLQSELAEWLETVADMERESPAQSAKLSNPD